MDDAEANGLRPRLALLWIVAAVVATIAVFVIPWRVPAADVALGESYALGFSNRAAVVGLGLVIGGVILALTLAGRTDPGAVDARGWFRMPEEIWPDASDDETRAELWVLGVASFVMVQFVLWWDSVLVIPYWGEADYFLSRIDLVALGSKPYVDFSYLYGPANLYVPLWLDRFSSGSLGLERAYAWTVAASYVAGFVCNAVFLRVLALPRGWRPGLLALCCVMWMPLSMGLQYTPLRFMVVPSVLAALLATDAGSPSAPRRGWAAPLVAVGGTAAAFLLFPEMGVVCAAASLAFACSLGLRGRLLTAVAIAAGVAVTAFLIHLGFPGYFQGMAAFMKGAMNFPIYPNLHNLLLVGVSLYVIGTAGATALVHPGDGRAPFIAALAAASTVLLSPSLGRCDPGHVAINSAMLFLTMFAVAAARGRTWFLAWVGVFTVAMVVFVQFSFWSHYRPAYTQAIEAAKFYKSNPQAVFAWQQSWERRRRQEGVPAALNWRRTVPFPDLATHGVFAAGASLAGAGEIQMDRFMKTQARYKTPFHPAPKPDLHVPDDVDRAVRDARREAIVLLPDQVVRMAQQGGSVDLAAYESRISSFLSGLMIFPCFVRMRNAPFIPEIELGKSLLREGEVVGTGGGYAVLRMRSR